jgi:hypothetical protein
VAPELHRPDQHLLQLALADHVAPVVLAAALEDAVHHLQAGRLREPLQLVQGLQRLLRLAGRHPDHEAALGAGDAADLVPGPEVPLQIADEGLPVQLPAVHRAVTLDLPGLLGPVDGVGIEVAELDLAGEAVHAGLDDDDGVQAQQAEVGHVVAAEALAAQMGVHEAQTAEPTGAGAGAGQVGDEEPVGIPDDDVRGVALPVDGEADLPTRLARELGHPPRQLGGDHPVDRRAAPVELLNRLQLGLLEPFDVSVNLGNVGLRLIRAYPETGVPGAYGWPSPTRPG